MATKRCHQRCHSRLAQRPDGGIAARPLARLHCSKFARRTAPSLRLPTRQPPLRERLVRSPAAITASTSPAASLRQPR